MAAAKEPVTGKKVAKVPVIMQLEALECGAACLDMILAGVRQQPGIVTSAAHGRQLISQASPRIWDRSQNPRRSGSRRKDICGSCAHFLSR